MKQISSRSNPLVATFKALAATPDSAGGRLLLDGAHLVREALDARLRFESVAVTSSALETNEEIGRLVRELGEAGEPVILVADSVMRAMSPVQHPQGIVAIAARDPSATLLSDSPDAFFLVLTDIQDPGNLGAVIRAGEAGGVTQVILCGACAHPFGWRTLRGSMGSLLRIPIAQYPTALDGLQALRQSGTSVVAAVARGGTDPDRVGWSGRVALLVGGEGPGLAPDVVALAATRVTVPMAPPVESLNVATAVAILVYAARRRRLEHVTQPSMSKA